MEVRGFRLVERPARTAGGAVGLPSVTVRDVADLSPRGFDLAGTLTCGQAFRWRALPDGRFAGVVGGRAYAASLARGGRDLVLDGATAEDFAGPLFDLLDLGRDYAPILAACATDDYMERAIARCGGIRLLRQPFAETVFSYILSAMNGIPRIMGLVEALSASYGRPLPGSAPFAGAGHATAPDGSLFAFPTTDALADAAARCRGRLDACRADALCGSPFAGYRCPLLLRAALALRAGAVPDPTALAGMTKEAARRTLQALPGVGPKVADCTLLSAGLRTDVCPVDRWVERVLVTQYLGGPERIGTVRADDVRRFAEDRFGAWVGIAQLWFFAYARSGGS